jgi:YHS domain-containing protein
VKLKCSKIFSLSALLLFVSCASNRPEEARDHHYHACKMEKCKMKHKCEKYGKKCAASVAHGDFHVEGKEDFMLTHEGHNYYFSSKEKMDKFNKNLDKNISKANEQWLYYDASFGH